MLWIPVFVLGPVIQDDDVLRIAAFWPAALRAADDAPVGAQQVRATPGDAVG